MIFSIHHPSTPCPYRTAARSLTRRYGMGSISLAKLSELLGCRYMIGRWL